MSPFPVNGSHLFFSSWHQFAEFFQAHHSLEMSERPDNPFQGASHVDLTLCGTSSDQMSNCDLQGKLNLIKFSATQGILNPVEKKSFLEDWVSSLLKIRFFVLCFFPSKKTSPVY